MLLAMGESTGRDLNQREPSMPIISGTRKTVIPAPCISRSLVMAPTTPIQLRAGEAMGVVAAVFQELSSGE